MLFEASSVFVDQVELRVVANRSGAVLSRFLEKPQPSLEVNWTVWDYDMIVRSNNSKGFTLWLNKGSRIQMQWEARLSHLDRVEIALVKGEKKYETLMPSFTSSLNSLAVKRPTNSREAEYSIEKDGKYYVSITNKNSVNIITTVKVNVSSRMYDLTKANSTCSTLDSSCRIKLPFPYTHYVVLTTPDNSDTVDWDVEVIFVARVITYVAILGFIVFFIILILRYLGVCDSETETYMIEDPLPPPVREVTETTPIFPHKQAILPYRTNGEEDDDGGSSSSSEDLYDAMLCVICYDDQRNCFFVPCGHCATCYDCAQRIMESDSKVCPICRRPIHKVRRLFRP
ncbi:hypothetical protein SAY87_010338 [Trapa incisa]|uniref:RING-type domain-containing protein n=1 Tax=Trapa incisa TaxID=236973 RepID=A0AAN7GEF2_9MYRT|nr:hypothetical protein SAY87_010338 [Trapa incisa]